MNPTRAGLAVMALLAITVLACNEGDTVVQTAGPVSGINVNGTGRATGTPDVAQIQVGVEVEAASVEAARDQAATAQNAVISSLKSNGVADNDIQTQQFSIQPQYDFVPATPGVPGRQVIRGYRVSNLLVVKVRDLTKVSKTLDDASRAGGNNAVVRGISFTIDDPEELKAQAREEAVRQARSYAEELARHSGVSLGKLLAISESGGPEPLTFQAAPRAATQAETPIQPGQLDVVITVNATWLID
jgi:uncharacterized protein